MGWQSDQLVTTLEIMVVLWNSNALPVTLDIIWVSFCWISFRAVLHERFSWIDLDPESSVEFWPLAVRLARPNLMLVLDEGDMILMICWKSPFEYESSLGLSAFVHPLLLLEGPRLYDEIRSSEGKGGHAGGSCCIGKVVNLASCGDSRLR